MKISIADTQPCGIMKLKGLDVSKGCNLMADGEKCTFKDCKFSSDHNIIERTRRSDHFTN